VLSPSLLHFLGKSDGHEPHDEVTMSHSTSPVDQLSSNIHRTLGVLYSDKFSMNEYSTEVSTPKGSVVNFRDYWYVRINSNYIKKYQMFSNLSLF
jgi:hypothetical protein